jgi:ParB/RepB/Spo0J family partition protein
MKKENNNVADLPIDLIDQHPRNPHRVLPEEVEQLMASIAVNGQHMPITVTQRPDGRYVAVAGNTRLAACKALGHTHIKGLVVKFKNETDELEHMLASNEAHKKSHAENAREMKIWTEIYGNKQGQRSDLENGEAWDTRKQLAKQYQMSESNVGKLMYVADHNTGILEMIDKYNLSIEGGFQLTKFAAENGKPLDDETLFVAQIIDLVDVGLLEQVRNNKLPITKAFKQAVATLGKIRKTEKVGGIRPEKDVQVESSKKSKHKVVESPLIGPNGELVDAAEVSSDDVEVETEESEEQDSGESNDETAIGDENHRSTEDGAVYCENEECPLFGTRIR